MMDEPRETELLRGTERQTIYKQKGRKRMKEKTASISFVMPVADGTREKCCLSTRKIRSGDAAAGITVVWP